ncbi:hypothetical protein HZB02_05155 [Candidatus Woesearchaeota archaeon]|nr:hypothetical protein [Candidatus Woesearchaeota archaeon]
MDENILVFGAGAIGTYLGAMLYYSGLKVSLLGKRKLQQCHDTVVIDGIPYQMPPKVTSDAILTTPFPTIFVTTKIYDSQYALIQLLESGQNPSILCLTHNGIVDDNFYGPFAHHRGLLTVSIFEGYRLDGAELKTTKSALGWQTDDSPQGKRLEGLLSTAGIGCHASPDFYKIRAEKMMGANAMGVLSALERKTFGELVQNDRTNAIIGAVLQESYDVLQEDYQLPPLHEITERFYQTIKTIATHYSSMYQDLMSGRNTEIEFLNGQIMRMGETKGLQTPVNNELYLRFIEQASLT